MPTQSESPAAVSGTSSKTLQLLRKRLRQLLRVTLVLAICLAVAATALAIWWLTSLNGLPDIGDPFDVAAFRAFSIPDDQNAFTFLRRASQKLTPMARFAAGSTRTSKFSWSIRRIRSCGSGPRRIARRSNCFSRGPNNPTPRTRPEIPRPTCVTELDRGWPSSRGAGDKRAATRRAPGTVIARSSA